MNKVASFRIDDEIRKIARERVEGFGLQSWLEHDCTACHSRLQIADILSFEVNFQPIFLGNVSFNYHCKNCDALICLHLQCDVRNLPHLWAILTSSPVTSPMVDSCELFENKTNNAFELLKKKMANG